jgi:hypothetical protein
MKIRTFYLRLKNKVISGFLSCYYRVGGTVRHLRDNNKKEEIVVSLTSFTPRLNKLYIALGSIFNQSLQPDKVVLYLGDDVDPDQLPQSLLNYCKYGLEIRFVENLRSHKKYFYSLREFPEALVITVDDDLIYHKNMVKKLYSTHLQFPKCICAMRTHEIIYDDNHMPCKYSAWLKNSSRYDVPSDDLFFTSGAGTLFPPACFDDAAYDIEKIKRLCYTADDVWLNCMCRRRNVKIVNVKLDTYEKQLLKVMGTQEVALKHHNLYDSGNDSCIHNLLEEFGIGAL